MAYSPKQQSALDVALQVYKDRIANISTTLDKIEALSASREYGGEYKTTHGENTRLRHIMKLMFIELRHDLNVAEEMGLITRDEYYEHFNAVGDRLLAFEAANPKAFKIV